MNESQLELSVMELFGQEGYEYINGESLLRQTSDVLLRDDLKAYLLSRYSTDAMTETEADSIILSLVRSSHDPLYDANRQMLHKITEGFIVRREDKQKKICSFAWLTLKIRKTTSSKSSISLKCRVWSSYASPMRWFLSMVCRSS